jgi:hypothetical protein
MPRSGATMPKIRLDYLPTMQYWMVRLLTANSLEEVFQG